MVKIALLTRKLEERVASASLYLQQQKELSRTQYLHNLMLKGGKEFIDRVRKYGCTENGSPLNLTPGYLEYLELLGDFRVKTVLVSGSAQVGKTLGHLLLMTDAITTGKINGAWFYASKTALDQMVPIQFHPLARGWIEKMKADGHRFRGNYDRTVNTRFQVDGANAIFSYVSTSSYSRRASGKAAVGGAAASFQANFLILEERSQYGHGEADVTYDRIANSLIPTKPVRQLGTPGGGMGIEAEMTDVDYNFYPHYTCSNCGATNPLDPKGCVLKEIERPDMLGNLIRTHLSESGRPVEWWCDPNHEDRVKGAYVGCSSCGHPIESEQRVTALYRCTRSGRTLRDFLDQLPPLIPEKMYRIAIHLSPLCRVDPFVASDIISKGLASENTANWQQQTLGHPSETETLYVTPGMLRDRIGKLPPPNTERTFRLAGIDVGRSEDWLMIVDYYVPPLSHHLTLAQMYEQSIRHIIFGSDVVRSTIPRLLDEYYVEYGMIDNEPSRESSINLCRSTCLDMGNQVSGLRDAVKQRIAEDGGVGHPCWDLRVEKFMLSVFQGFVLKAWDGDRCWRLPAGWEKWLGNPTELSPLVHLAAPWRDSNGSWQRGKNNLDDFYMALVFAETAFYLKLMAEYSHSSSVGIGRYSI